MSPRYIARAPHAWGEASTAAEAIRRAVANVPSHIRDYAVEVFEVGPAAHIDGHGDLVYPKTERAPEHISSVTKRGRRS